MQQSVESGRGALTEIGAFQQDRPVAAHRSISNDADSGGSTPYDNDVGLETFIGCSFHSWLRSPDLRIPSRILVRMGSPRGHSCQRPTPHRSLHDRAGCTVVRLLRSTVRTDAAAARQRDRVRLWTV